MQLYIILGYHRTISAMKREDKEDITTISNHKGVAGALV